MLIFVAQGRKGADMPKWLSSSMIFIGFLALVVMAVLPRNIDVTVTTNVKQASSHSTTHYNSGTPVLMPKSVETLTEDQSD